MIINNCGNVPKNQSTQQIGVRWTIATDIEMTNVVDYSGTVTTSDGSYISPVVTEDGVVYYSSFVRVYSDGSVDQPSAPKACSSRNTGLGCLEYDVPTISTPTVVASMDDVSNIVVKTSNFKCDTDVHGSTSWVVVSGAGDILFSSVNDATNLLSITVPSFYITSDVVYVTVYACHHAGVTKSSISEYGRTVVDVSVMPYSVKLSSLLVRPSETLTVPVVLRTGYTTTGVFSIELKDSSGNELWSNVITDKSTRYFKIPGAFLEPSQTYYVVLHTLIDLATVQVSVKIKTVDSYLGIPEQLGYTYAKKFVPVTSSVPVAVDFNFRTVEVVGRGVLVPFNDGTVCTIVYDGTTSSVSFGKSCMSGLSLLNTNSNNANTLITTDGIDRFIVDTLSLTGIPTFVIFQYSYATGLSSVLNTVSRPTETLPTGFVNNLVQIDTTKYVYYSSTDSKLKMLDIAANSITDLVVVPGPVGNSLTLIRRSSDEVLVLGLDYVYSYVLSTKILSKELVLPAKFVSRTLVAVKLINNDYLIHRHELSNVDNDNDVLYFDNSSLSFTTIPLAKETIGSMNASARLVSGEILFNGVDGFITFV